MNNLPKETSSLSYGFYGRPAHRVVDAAQLLAFFEGRVFQTLFTNDVYPVVQQGEMAGYHNKLGVFVVTYADGHAAFADFGNGTYKPHNQGDPPYDEEMDFRGTWGRFDNLPDPPMDI